MTADLALKSLSDALDDPWGLISPSFYDTAHVVRAWSRNPERVPPTLGAPALAFLLDRQNPDGSWGRPSTPRAYRLVPTLAAAVALSARTRSAPAAAAAEHDRVLAPLRHGLAHLTTQPVPRPDDMPDTVAVEYLVPALFEELHARLADASPGDAARVEHAMRPFVPWRGLLRLLREHIRAGAAVPVQRDHCWEIFDSEDAPVPVPPFRDGSVVCSPAATAAALARCDRDVPAAEKYLALSPPALGGAQPVVLPLVVFERVWVLTALLHAGIPLSASVRAAAIAALRPFWTPAGVGAAPGLAIEADDTANYLLALLRLGEEPDLSCLLAFEDEAVFRTYHTAERNVSVSTNAHVLEALTAGMARRPGLAAQFAAPAAKARDFVLDSQTTDGHWVDKWHASPLYATSCAVFALLPSSDPRIGRAVRRTTDWLLGTQRRDGSWGRWCGTLEETSYAVTILARHGHGRGGSAVRTAVERGLRFLDAASGSEQDDDARTPLWHSKELYSPLRLVGALVLGARHAARRYLEGRD
ncbi:prenyltransferase/squalene oxidase repeat-containing protein [Streptomyces sp. NPDC007861]|uniref:prenyltransferase/squalene oxidase repeat-containing protein n=1 Tax=Streptomyces sp. NPDC007861 TaxID=3154893 RepID=UPI00340E1782